MATTTAPRRPPPRGSPRPNFNTQTGDARAMGLRSADRNISGEIVGGRTNAGQRVENPLVQGTMGWLDQNRAQKAAGVPPVNPSGSLTGPSRGSMGWLDQMRARQANPLVPPGGAPTNGMITRPAGDVMQMHGGQTEVPRAPAGAPVLNPGPPRQVVTRQPPQNPLAPGGALPRPGGPVAAPGFQQPPVTVAPGQPGGGRPVEFAPGMHRIVGAHGEGFSRPNDVPPNAQAGIYNEHGQPVPPRPSAGGNPLVNPFPDITRNASAPLRSLTPAGGTAPPNAGTGGTGHGGIAPVSTGMNPLVSGVPQLNLDELEKMRKRREDYSSAAMTDKGYLRQEAHRNAQAVARENGDTQGDREN